MGNAETASAEWPEPMESLALAISDAHPLLAWLYEHPMICRGMARAALDYLTPAEKEQCGMMPMTRIAEIDAMFESATGWGSWMVSAANEREELVDRLRADGLNVEHRYQARLANGERTD